MKIYKHSMKDGKVYLLGDVHIGHIQADKENFKRAIKDISVSAGGDDLVVFMGDLLDSVLPTDRRFDIRGFESMEEAKTWFDSVIEPLADMSALFLEGNHEYKISRNGDNPIKFFLHSRPKWEFGTYGAVIDLGKSWGYVNHGHGGGRYHGAKVNNIEREAGYFDGADFLFMGHVHWLFTNTFVKLRYKKSKPHITQNKMLIGYTGCILRTYVVHDEVAGYGERALYNDVERGYLVMNVENHKPVKVDRIGL